MSRRDPTIAVNQMVEYAIEAVKMCYGKTREDLDKERVLNLALVRLLEIIGEAANRVPTDIQNRYQTIPWFQIVSLRNRLIHGYDEVDFDVLWEIINSDLPKLIQSLSQMNDEKLID